MMFLQIQGWNEPYKWLPDDFLLTPHPTNIRVVYSFRRLGLAAVVAKAVLHQSTDCAQKANKERRVACTENNGYFDLT